MADTDTPEDKAKNQVVGSEPSTTRVSQEAAEKERTRQPQNRSRTVKQATTAPPTPARRPSSPRAPQPSSQGKNADVPPAVAQAEPRVTPVDVQAGAVPPSQVASRTRSRAGQQAAATSTTPKEPPAQRGKGGRVPQPTAEKPKAGAGSVGPNEPPKPATGAAVRRGGGRRTTSQVSAPADEKPKPVLSPAPEPGVGESIKVKQALPAEPVMVSPTPPLPVPTAAEPLAAPAAGETTTTPTPPIPSPANVQARHHRRLSLRLWLSLVLMISGFFYIRMLAREEPELGSSFDPAAVVSQIKTYIDSVTTPAQVAKPESVRPPQTQSVKPIAEQPKAPAPPLGSSLMLPTGSPVATSSPQATGWATKAETPSVSQVAPSPIPSSPPMLTAQPAMTPAVASTPPSGRVAIAPEDRSALVTKGTGVSPSPLAAPVESQRTDIAQTALSKEKPLAAGSPPAAAGQTTTPALLQELRAMERSAKPEEIRSVTPPQERPPETRVPPAPTYSIQPRLRPEGYYGYGYSPGYYGPYGPWQMPAQPGYGQGRGANQ